VLAGIAVRQLECILCQRSFSMLAGDLIVPEANICDDCLREVWDMDERSLLEHVKNCLSKGEIWEGEADGSSMVDMKLVSRIVNNIKGSVGQGGRVEELIRQREVDRQIFG
jgi:hypothetical protein